VTEPVWIELQDCLAVHEQLLQRFGGRPGVRDQGLLESALTRAPHAFYYEPDKYRDIQLLSALYTSGIVKNHAMIDGNKRLGLVIGILFLELNGYEFFAEEAEAAAAIWKLAAGDLSDGGYLQFLNEHSRPVR
jgi:death-on-curing protein